LFLNDESPGDEVAQEVGDAHQHLGIKRLTCGGCFSMMKAPVTRLLKRQEVDNAPQKLGKKRLTCGGCFPMMKVPVTRLLKRSVMPTSSYVSRG
jgi:hypothetical protein